MQKNFQIIMADHGKQWLQNDRKSIQDTVYMIWYNAGLILMLEAINTNFLGLVFLRLFVAGVNSEHILLSKQEMNVNYK